MEQASCTLVWGHFAQDGKAQGMQRLLTDQQRQVWWLAFGFLLRRGSLRRLRPRAHFLALRRRRFVSLFRGPFFRRLSGTWRRMLLHFLIPHFFSIEFRPRMYPRRPAQGHAALAHGRHTRTCMITHLHTIPRPWRRRYRGSSELVSDTSGASSCVLGNPIFLSLV